jgi:AcrR family transcriptional regulator
MPAMSTATRARRAPGTPRRRSGVTRERVVDEALGIIERDGVDALSMRKLSAQLGVVPTSIYWHVGGREQLLDAVVERYTERLVATAVRGRTPDARLLSVARQIRDMARDHANLTAVALERGLSPALALPMQIALAREITAAGLRGKRAARATRSILYVVGGFIVLEPCMPPAVPAQRRSEELWADVEDRDLDPGLVQEMRRPAELDDVFEHTLTTLIASLLAVERRP